MKNLRKFRTALRFTQRQVAQALRTTQQTVGRWESGAAEPSLTALRDLAMLFGTSVDNLIGKGPYAHRLETVLPTAPRSAAARAAAGRPGPDGTGGLDGFKGHVGILLRGQEQSIWYPITDAEWRRTDNHLANADPGEPWACVRTCNNRLVAVNLGAVERICLLDRACPRPEHDWDPAQAGDAGRPFEFYKGLLNWFFDPEELAATASEGFIAGIRDFVRRQRFSVEDAERLLLQTHLH
ncbi:MAG: helix-turn-helix transcriptional regulator, partial [Desulfovibrionaceae bacterium]